MTAKMFTTNQYGEYTEHEVFAGASMYGVQCVQKGKARAEDFWGYGVALTDSSCYHLMKMSAEERHNLLRDLYAEDGTMHFRVARLSIGASDYSPVPYSYDDVAGDVELAHFSLSHDYDWVIPVVREVLEINPNVKVFAAPWSPPGWMKTGGSIGGGYMREQYLDCYAEYFVKYIEGYAKEGIRIAAVTPQNEPRDAQAGKSIACVWHPELEAKFIEILHEKFAAHGITTEIWVHDNNFHDARHVAWLLENHPKTAEACSGIAFHYYEGGVEETEFLREKFPQLALHMTEGGPRLFENYGTDWCKWGLMVLKVLSCRYASFTGWNLLLDEAGGPNIGPFFCGGLITRKQADGSLDYSGQYKALRHFAAIDKNAVISPLEFQLKPPCMSSYPREFAYPTMGCAAENPDGSTVLVLCNPAESKAQLQYHHNGAWHYIELMPNTLATVLFGE